MKKELFDLAVEKMTAKRLSKSWKDTLSGQGDTGGDNVLTGFITENGVCKDASYPCHKPINGFKDAAILWSAFGYRNSKEVSEYYFNWLINDSPWAKTGIIPEWHSRDFMFKTGFIFGDLDKTPGNLLHNFLIATRLDAEWPEFIAGWYKLVTEYQINPSYAFLTLTVFIPYEVLEGYNNIQGFVEKPFAILTHIDKYDWPLDMARATERYVRNFCSGDPEGVSSRMFSPSAQTAPVNTLWGDLVEATDSEAYVNILKRLYEKEFSKMNKVSYRSYSGQRTALVESYAFKNIIKIIRKEEVRLGITKTKKKAV